MNTGMSGYKKTNFLDVLDIRKRGNNTTDYEDKFYYHDDNESTGPYFENSMRLIKLIKKKIDNDFGKEYFFTEIEPFPKPGNSIKLEDFYENNEITYEKMRKHNNWNIRINKIKELLKGKIILVGTNYYNNFILNDLGIKKSIYQGGKIFIYEDSLYIKVEYFSYLTEEKIKIEIDNIIECLNKNSELNQKFINIINN